jgi:hypothetical protein
MPADCIVNRHIKGKQYDKATELLLSGATILLEHKQFSSGLDLSNYLLDVYIQASKPVTKDTLGNLLLLLSTCN